MARHNQIIETVYSSVQGTHMASLLPKEPSVITLNEFQQDTVTETELQK